MEDNNDRAYRITSMILKGNTDTASARLMCRSEEVWNIVKRNLIDYGYVLDGLTSNAVDSSKPVDEVALNRICAKIKGWFALDIDLVLWNPDLRNDAASNLFGHREIDPNIKATYFNPICENSFNYICNLFVSALKAQEKSPERIYERFLLNRSFLVDNFVDLPVENICDIPEKERRALVIGIFDRLNIRNEKLIVCLAMFYTKLYFHYHGRRSIFLKRMYENYQYFDSEFVEWLMEIRVVNVQMMSAAKYPDNVIDLLQQVSNNNFEVQARPIEGITNRSTEVYFWGLASTGKTCMIGAMLKVLHEAYDCEFDENCQGYNYMNKLEEIFKQSSDGYENLFILPPRTDTKNIFEMALKVTDPNTKKEHHITFVDMAGELIRAMALKKLGKDIPQQYQEVIETFRQMYYDDRNNNDRIHLFVWDYELGDIPKDGYTQNSLLKNAIEFLLGDGKDGRRIFTRRRDMAGIVFTKADLFRGLDKVKDGNYRAFYQEHMQHILDTMGVRNSLYNPIRKLMGDGKDVFFVPFSLGKVYFRRLCVFGTEAVNDILDFLIPNSYEGGPHFNKLGTPQIKKKTDGIMDRLRKVFFD